MKLAAECWTFLKLYSAPKTTSNKGADLGYLHENYISKTPYFLTTCNNYTNSHKFAKF